MATSSYLWNRMKGFSQAGPKIGGTGQPLEGFTTVKVPNGTIAQAGKRHGTHGNFKLSLESYEGV